MKEGEFIMNITFDITAVLFLICVLIFVAIAWFKFRSLTKEQKYAQIKEWLLQAVAFAEKQLGSKTGPLKLSLVYDMFVKTFPWLAKDITIEQFSEFVNFALQELQELLRNNDKISEYVEGAKG